MTYRRDVRSYHHSHESKTLRISRILCASKWTFREKGRPNMLEMLCAVRVTKNKLMQGAVGAVPLQQLAAGCRNVLMWNRATLPIHENIGGCKFRRNSSLIGLIPGSCREKKWGRIYERACRMKSRKWAEQKKPVFELQSWLHLPPNPRVVRNFFSRLHACRGEANATYEGGSVNERLRTPWE